MMKAAFEAAGLAMQNVRLRLRRQRQQN